MYDLMSPTVPRMGEVSPVEYLRRQIERRPYIERVRPGVAQIGEWLRRVHEELLRGVGGSPPDRWKDTPPLTPDSRWHNGLSEDEEQVVLNVARLLTTAVRDHLLALAILAENDAPTRSLLAMSRVLFDASCQARFVMEPGLRDGVRVVRAANLELLSLREEAHDAAPADRDEKLRERDHLRDRLVATGRYWPTSDGAQLQRGLDSKTIQEVAGRDGPQIHHMLSSAVHSVERSWIRTFTGREPCLGKRRRSPHGVSVDCTTRCGPLGNPCDPAVLRAPWRPTRGRDGGPPEDTGLVRNSQS